MNNEVRVLGKLISHENLHKYSGGNYSNPIFRNKNSDNVVIIEEVSDLPEEFGDRKYGYCNAEYIKKEYGVMGIEKIEDELKSKYISFTPKKFNENNDKNTYLVYNPRIEGNFKDLIVKTDLFVLATHYEGLPLVLCEAMASKTPIIATDVPGVNEIVLNEKTGLLVKENEVSDLANNILRMKNDENIREFFSEKAYRFINEEFNLELMYKKYEKRIEFMI